MIINTVGGGSGGDEGYLILPQSGSQSASSYFRFTMYYKGDTTASPRYIRTSCYTQSGNYVSRYFITLDKYWSSDTSRYYYPCRLANSDDKTIYLITNSSNNLSVGTQISSSVVQYSAATANGSFANRYPIIPTGLIYNDYFYSPKKVHVTGHARINVSSGTIFYYDTIPDLTNIQIEFDMEFSNITNLNIDLSNCYSNTTGSDLVLYITIDSVESV